MCGIIGVVSCNPARNSLDNRKYFEQALFTDCLRGFDSTGCFFVDGHLNRVEYIKRPVPAYFMQEMAPYSKLMNSFRNYSVAIGHNRKATQGKINTENAHPFLTDNLIGVHNGTLFNTHRIPSKGKYDVDSEAALNAISEVGSEAAIKELQGAFAFVWHDYNDRLLHVIRNKERPLCYGISEDKSTMFIASEGPMLFWLAFRNQIKLDRIEEFEVGYEYMIDESEKEIQIEREKRELASPFTRTHTGYGNGRSSQHTQSNHSTRRVRPSQTIVESMGYKVSEYVDIMLYNFEPYKNPAGSGRGIIYGFVIDKEATPVMIHGGSIGLYEELEPENVKGRIVGAVELEGKEKIHQDLEGNRALLVDAKTLYATEAPKPRRSSKSTDEQGENGKASSKENGQPQNALMLAGEDDEDPFVTSPALT